MPIQVLEWRFTPGQSDLLPEPVLKDDSDRLPAEVVKSLREWLQAEAPKFQARRTPSPQILTASQLPHQGGVRFDEKPNLPPPTLQLKPGMSRLTFEVGTIEILLRQKGVGRVPGMIIGKFHYLSARSGDGQYSIVGPRLWLEKLGAIQ